MEVSKDDLIQVVEHQLTMLAIQRELVLSDETIHEFAVEVAERAAVAGIMEPK